jgi:hypothetical protein
MAKRNILQMIGISFLCLLIFLNTSFSSDFADKEKELIKQVSEKLDAAIIGKLFEMLKNQGLIKENIPLHEWKDSKEAKSYLSMVNKANSSPIRVTLGRRVKDF